MDILQIQESLDRIEQLLIDNKRVLNFDEACDFMGVSRSFMYKLTASKKIPHCKPNGKLIFFEKKKLEDWLLEYNRKTADEIKPEALNNVLNGKKHSL